MYKNAGVLNGIIFPLLFLPFDNLRYITTIILINRKSDFVNPVGGKVMENKGHGYFNEAVFDYVTLRCVLR